jgi:release factor glutamine methyltransferase
MVLELDREIAPGPTVVDAAGGLQLRDAIRWAVRALTQSGSETPRLDAEVLLAHALELSRPELYARWNNPLERSAGERFTRLVRRRMAHEPVAYLVGRRAFYDVELAVDVRVLIPRPETEQLVDEALSWARRTGRPALTIVDVGAGSGAIALVLARHLTHAAVVACDVSFAALSVAAANLLCYGLWPRVSLVCADLLSFVGASVDLIVANLPYISRERMETLPIDVADYEPHLALDGGADGLALVRRLLQEAATCLAAPGLLLLEIDDQQGQAVVQAARQHLPDAQCDVLRDYAGLERLVRVERRIH